MSELTWKRENFVLEHKTSTEGATNEKQSRGKFKIFYVNYCINNISQSIGLVS